MWTPLRTTSLGRVITDDLKFETEIRRCMLLKTDTFQKLNNLLRDRKITFKTNKRVLDCLVISILLTNSESLTFFTKHKIRLANFENNIKRA